MQGWARQSMVEMRKKFKSAIVVFSYPLLIVLGLGLSACTERLTKEQASPPTKTHRAEFLHLPIPEDTGEGIIMPETKVLGGESERSDSESEERR